ncbi:phage tail assembly chaperone [Segnochrobactraceae bacterium EtOH-i3]
MNLGKLLCAELKRNLEKGGRPRLPAGGDLLWRWFNDLSAARSWGETGPAPVTHAEISAYAGLTCWPIEARHVAILRAMDDAFLDHCRRERARALGNDHTVQPINMTAGRFDALFG